MEIFFALLYAGLIGFYNIFKKFAVRKSNESVILVMFTTIAFLLSLIWIPSGIMIHWKFILIFAVKGFLLALSWFLILKVLKSADLSLVTVTNTLSSVLSFVLGIVIFNEEVGLWQVIGSVIVVLGVAAINLVNRKSQNKTSILHLLILIVAALITTTSVVIDKYTTTYLTAQQVQFWYFLFVMFFSWIFFIIECLRNKQFLIKKHDLKNFWIYLAGIFLFVGDLMLFFAYKVPNSQMITISILSQLKIIVAVFAGVLLFKEKNVCKKILLSLIVIFGAVLISVF